MRYPVTPYLTELLTSNGLLELPVLARLSRDLATLLILTAGIDA